MRLIDADALMKIVDSEIERVEEEMRDAEERPNLYTDEFRKHRSYTVSGMAHIAEDILEAPTIDAVPVVMCKDCRHCNTDWAMGKWYGSCKEWNTHSVMADWYCVNGERKDDE